MILVLPWNADMTKNFVIKFVHFAIDNLNKIKISGGFYNHQTPRYILLIIISSFKFIQRDKIADSEDMSVCMNENNKRIL